MNSCKSNTRTLSRCFLVAAALCWSAPSQAALTHRYSFTNDVTDSVGGANGTIQGNVTISGGAASFPGQSNQDYIELPAGLVTNYTAATFELWVNVLDNGTWEEIYAFGNQGTDGTGGNMLMFTPHSGSSPNDFRMSYAQTQPGFNDEHVVTGTGILDNVGPVSVTCVYDPPHNSMALYTNGVLVGSLSPVTTGAKGFSFTNIIDNHCWLGRSLYNADAPYNGTIDEFRLYNTALSPLQIYVNAKAGPDTIVTNIVVNSLTWNTQTNMIVGSRQSTTVTFNTAAYGSVTLPGATEPTYSSSDPTTVAVTASGQLNAMAVGSATVSAVYNGTTNKALVTVTQPQLIHRYSFTTDASDSVGNAAGKLVGGATVSGGALVLPGGVASSDPAAAYLDLPNNLLTNVTAVTIEAWVEDNSSGSWARVWDFGSSIGGEDVSDTGSRTVYVSLPNGGGNLQGTIHVNDRGGDASITSPAPPAGQLSQVLWASDIANHTSWLYVNGTLVGANNNTTVSPADMGPTFNDWLGRSQYGADSTFAGKIDEFRIYNGAFSPLQVGIDQAAGPDKVVSDPGAIQALRLSASTNAVYYGGAGVTTTLKADYAGVTNVTIPFGSGVVYTSTDTSAVTVDDHGVVLGSGIGTATITASYGGKTATLPVTVTALPGYTKATLVHRYSFNDAAGSTSVKDSVGTADGAIKGKGAVFSGKGQLSLPGGGISSDDASTISAYVDLPNHIVNVMTDVSLEAWVTWQGSGSWQRIFDLGTSDTGEDSPTGNGNYLYMTPMGAANYEFSVRDPATSSEPAPLIAPAPLLANQPIYVAVTYDHTANGARLYSNAVVVASGAAPVDIKTIDDVNNWLGRSQYAGDAMFQGVYDEFRIWNGTLLPDEVSAHYAAGPDSLEAPPSAPKLTASVSGKTLTVSWPASATGYVLQSTTKLGSGGTWTAVSTPPTTVNGVSSVSIPIGTGSAFYRLSH